MVVGDNGVCSGVGWQVCGSGAGEKGVGKVAVQVAGVQRTEAQAAVQNAGRRQVVAVAGVRYVVCAGRNADPQRPSVAGETQPQNPRSIVPPPPINPLSPEHRQCVGVEAGVGGGGRCVCV